MVRPRGVPSRLGPGERSTECHFMRFMILSIARDFSRRTTSGGWKFRVQFYNLSLQVFLSYRYCGGGEPDILGIS